MVEVSFIFDPVVFQLIEVEIDICIQLCCVFRWIFFVIESAEALELVIDPITSIGYFVTREIESTPTINFVFLPLAIIGCSIWISKLALPMSLSMSLFSFIFTTIFIFFIHHISHSTCSIETLIPTRIVHWLILTSIHLTPIVIHLTSIIIHLTLIHLTSVVIIIDSTFVDEILIVFINIIKLFNRELLGNNDIW